MNKKKALRYLHDNIEIELEIIKQIHDSSRDTSFLSDAQNKSKEDKQYVKCMEDIQLLHVADCISIATTKDLRDTINSARQWIEV